MSATRKREEIERLHEDREFAVRRLELEAQIMGLRALSRVNLDRPVASGIHSESLKMWHPFQPCKLGKYVWFYKVYFEIMCELHNFPQSITWFPHLLTLISCEAAKVVTRLPAEQAQQYEILKEHLQKTYRLSALTFR